jgi:uncharacterized membrane protein
MANAELDTLAHLGPADALLIHPLLASMALTDLHPGNSWVDDTTVAWKVLLLFVICLPCLPQLPATVSLQLVSHPGW